MSNTCTLNNLNEDAVISVYVEAIMKAALNIQAYVKHGIIVDGRVTDYWPKRKSGPQRGHNLMIRGEVRHKFQMLEDINFFTGGQCQEYLDDMGIQMNADKMLEQALACNVRSIALFATNKPGRKVGEWMNNKKIIEAI